MKEKNLKAQDNEAKAPKYVEWLPLPCFFPEDKRTLLKSISIY